MSRFEPSVVIVLGVWRMRSRNSGIDLTTASPRRQQVFETNDDACHDRARLVSEAGEWLRADGAVTRHDLRRVGK